MPISPMLKDVGDPEVVLNALEGDPCWTLGSFKISRFLGISRETESLSEGLCPWIRDSWEPGFYGFAETVFRLPRRGYYRFAGVDENPSALLYCSPRLVKQSCAPCLRRLIPALCLIPRMFCVDGPHIGEAQLGSKVSWDLIQPYMPL
ncbi:hypothetical protein DY000_02052578 [Brassica cretica]|uniref:Uncharacterized protein n=1 Tax=Brassica cretica TaxID=69181 RepID=A0ABQ7AFX5_BRACR|nr:hypothetical protein DY000_02052578 [Brassica cretica]